MAKKLASVITITSRLITWVSSCAITPSSSAGSSSSRMPRVAHTVVDFFERPIAQALGIEVSITPTRGLGRLACTHSRSTIPCSSGSCAGVTSLTPIVASAILSEAKNCTSSIPAATITITPAPAPAANSTPTNTTYTRPSRNMVSTIRACRPVSLPNFSGRLAIARIVADGAHGPINPVAPRGAREGRFSIECDTR